MHEYWIGTTVFAFDGTVLEIFGLSDVRRYHIYHIQCLKLSQARRGTMTLTVMAPGRGTPMLTLENEQDVAAAEALIAAINQARAARNWSAVPTS